MIKIRVTFVGDEKGKIELKELLNVLGKDKIILNMSKEYKGRGGSMYNNIYIDLE